MKRSEINKALRELEAMCEKYKCYLPPFCHFTPEEWKTKGHEYDEVRDCMLGWDITDFGLGDFDKFGFSLIASYVFFYAFSNLRNLLYLITVCCAMSISD